MSPIHVKCFLCSCAAISMAVHKASSIRTTAHSGGGDGGERRTTESNGILILRKTFENNYSNVWLPVESPDPTVKHSSKHSGAWPAAELIGRRMKTALKPKNVHADLRFVAVEACLWERGGKRSLEHETQGNGLRVASRVCQTWHFSKCLRGKRL